MLVDVDAPEESERAPCSVAASQDDTAGPDYPLIHDIVGDDGKPVL